MDAYNFYLSTLRYVMNADATDKSTWCDIFKYLPCLRQMLSCCVCGSIMLRPKGPTHGVCLHHVCSACVGGRMRLRPSCSWCKDHEHFTDNTKLRVLVLCFKKLCSYVAKSKLGAEISKTSVNGYSVEAECTMKILKEAEQFHDDYVLTPPPKDLPMISKSSCGGIKISSQFQSVSFNSEMNNFESGAGARSRSNTMTMAIKRGRGRPRAAGRFTMIKTPSKSSNSLRARVNKLRKKALNPKMKNHPKSRNFVKTTRPYKKRLPPDTTDFLIAQRPHRERSGKYSVGQLWRETFLEEPQPDQYPDSGIEVGSSSDQDHNSVLPPLSKITLEKSDDAVSSKVEVSRKETRHYKIQENGSSSKPELSVNDVTSSSDEPGKPRLTLTISKKRFQKFNGRSSHVDKFQGKKRHFNDYEIPSSDLTVVPNFKRTGLKIKANHIEPKKPKMKTCRCARFKKPNHLTCFGQKCPCYSERRGCINCLCNGCKNPLQNSDMVPPLMHILRDGDNLDSSFDRSMPRLSPIPKL